MCGIVGIYGLRDAGKMREAIWSMKEAVSHRGPDDEGEFYGDAVALGHRRLSIVDLSANGRQPMTSPDGRFVIVWNGELYNYKSLKSTLSDYPFRSNTDTEVVLASFAKKGKDCLNDFNGMFAFAVWDSLRRELFLARDRFGIKPLYYWRSGDVFLFSSELRAILASGIVPRKLNERALADYLRYQTVHEPETIVQNVKQVPAGSYLKLSKDGLEERRYWSFKKNVEANGCVKEDYENVCKEVRRRFFRAVERELMGDVPLGIFLSGGIDSSAIVAACCEVSPRTINTFSVVFKEPKFNEAFYSGKVAKRFETRHHEIAVGVSDLLSELPGALKSFDHPSGDGINTYFISKKVKEAGITVALSGLGGDEIFCGYPLFRHNAFLARNRWIWNLSREARLFGGRSLKRIHPSPQVERLSRLLALPNGDFENVYPVFRQVFWDDEISELTGKSPLPDNCVRALLRGEAIRGDYLMSQVSAAEAGTYLPSVLLRDTDQMSMSRALEVRVPFLDHELVEYVLRLPDRLKYPSTPKKLLVDALGSLLPTEIVNRPKMGFAFPWAAWLKGELKSFCETRIRSLSERPWFRSDQVMKLWNEFQEGREDTRWLAVWLLVVLEHWIAENDIG